ncbi:aspartate--tRNA ligase 2, cytoplasmic-like [Helianthus annuus]|uniref:aspartate--tRNA ligase 2, cytoplasmic-like n=1 Tax=Helianthus annuus TaxID=4232 RepID=UPI001652C4E8|nr:aspartate--tRNA ligase 2, cytoplasmic-like [Helianthus annuus]
MRCERGCSFEVEVQVCKIHCVSKAPPGLTINVEDAATSEAEIYKALEISKVLCVKKSSDAVMVGKGTGRLSFLINYLLIGDS